MNKYLGFLFTVFAAFSFVDNVVASQDHDKKFFDEKTKEVIKLHSGLCGIGYGLLYSAGPVLSMAVGLNDLLFAESLKDIFSDMRGMNREWMKMANRATKRTLPLAAGWVGYEVWKHKKYNEHTFGFGR